MQPGVDGHRVKAHRQVQRALTGVGQETAVVVTRFGHGRGTVLGGVKHAEVACREAAAQHIDMGERGHDGPAARAEKSLLAWHPFDLAQFFAHTFVAHRFKGIQCVEVVRIGHPVEQVDGRVACGHDAAGLLPAHAAHGKVGCGAPHRGRRRRSPGQDQPPPRTPSR